MTVDTWEVVTPAAFMIGVKEEVINEYLDSEMLARLKENKDACTIRYLNKLRTTMFLKFKKTDDEMRFNLRNINSIEWYDHDEIRKLEKWGYQIIKANTRSEQYQLEFTKLITENIDKCRDLFPEWVNWEYIKELFAIPHYNKKGVMKKEFDKFMANLNYYPFQMYIYWEPKESGNILFSDKKFLTTVYEMHDDYIADKSRYRDAHEDTKVSIYNFIEDSDKIAIVVDCENSDAYKLYNVLKNLDADMLSKISKVVLYDDYHTGTGWDHLEKFIRIPVEHEEVERVTDQKSLVDIKMTAGVCRDFYRDGITSFILLSSDSDYWGLISSLPDADFLVMYEDTKCGAAIKEALAAREIYYCSIDDFCSGNTEEFKRFVLLSALEERLPGIIGMDSQELLEQLYTQTRIYASESEKQIFYKRYIKTLKLKIDSDGKFIAVIDR
ncbi:MAG: NYN domain-containing protein [Oscillospiraceae bacterium]|nr:NYN domain-containing protein [Oscillospiraceae bacterium]